MWPGRLQTAHRQSSSPTPARLYPPHRSPISLSHQPAHPYANLARHRSANRHDHFQTSAHINHFQTSPTPNCPPAGPPPPRQSPASEPSPRATQPHAAPSLPGQLAGGHRRRGRSCDHIRRLRRTPDHRWRQQPRGISSQPPPPPSAPSDSPAAHLPERLLPDAEPAAAQPSGTGVAAGLG